MKSIETRATYIGAKFAHKFHSPLLERTTVIVEIQLINLSLPRCFHLLIRRCSVFIFLTNGFKISETLLFKIFELAGEVFSSY